MAPKKDWDVDKYFDETETEVQWELRKKFMLTHKDKYSEHRLVSLARTFANIQFLGCRYNDDLMKLIENLTREIPAVIDYRKQQKLKLQKTFVMASEPSNRNIPVKNLKRFGSEDLPTPPIKKFKPNANPDPELELTPSDKSILDRVRNQEGIKSKFIIMTRPYTQQNPYTILRTSADVLRMQLTVEKFENDQYVLKIDNEIVVSGTAKNEKEARMELAKEALTNLRDYCFELVLADPCEGQSIEKPEDKAEAESEENNALPDNNIGAKIMKLMGWKGKGLGKEEHGRQEPVVAEQRIDRLGLGLGKGIANIRVQVQKCLKEYISKGDRHNLVFSDFDKVERAQIHSIAKKFNLKSVSFGKEDINRRLVISRKMKPWEIVVDILAKRKCPNYSLIKPNKMYKKNVQRTKGELKQ